MRETIRDMDRSYDICQKKKERVERLELFPGIYFVLTQ